MRSSKLKVQSSKEVPRLNLQKRVDGGGIDLELAALNLGFLLSFEL
jgi:hypothetical protein